MSAATASTALIAGGPAPLALLAATARRAPESEMARIALQFLGEATAAFFATTTFARLRVEADLLPPPLVERLLALIMKGPSFGTWVGILRETRKELGLDEDNRGQKGPRPAADAFIAAVRGESERGSFGDIGSDLNEQLKFVKSGTVLAAFDFLVYFRNRIYGHGAGLPEDVAKRLGPVALEFVCELASHQNLSAAEDVLCQIHATPQGLEWYSLRGLTPERLLTKIPVPANASLGTLYYLIEGVPYDLLPLIAHLPAVGNGAPSFGFFQRTVRAAKSTRRGQEVEYLDYNGKPFRAEAAAASAQQLAELLDAMRRVFEEAELRRLADERERERRARATALGIEIEAELESLREVRPREGSAQLFAALSRIEEKAALATSLNEDDSDAKRRVIEIRRLIVSLAIDSGDLNVAEMYLNRLKEAAHEVEARELRDLASELQAKWEICDPARNRDLKAVQRLALIALTSGPLAAVIVVALIGGRETGWLSVVVGIPLVLNSALHGFVVWNVVRARGGEEGGIAGAIIASYFGVFVSLMGANLFGVVSSLAALDYLNRQKTAKLLWRAPRAF